MFSLHRFYRRFFPKKSCVLSTSWTDWGQEQTERIRRGEPIQWMMRPDIMAGRNLPSLDIIFHSVEMDRLNDRVRLALRRKQDSDWESWSPKQREQARQNGEYYGKERIQ